MLHTEYVLSADLTERLAKKIEAETGWSFAATKRRDLCLAIRRMAESIGVENDAECVDWLLSGAWDKPKADLCAHYLTIGETYFFREPRAFGLVADYAREKIKAFGAANTRLRIWSAGCCTGEEAYSVAMALRQAVPELPSGQISILGTDINSRYLQFARAGVYRQWSFRNTEAARHKPNFSAAGEGQFRLHDEIRELVQFSELNLASPVYPSIATDTHAMDIIFCRNVLMYFSRAQALHVIERLRQCLVEGGWLIVSPSEASAELFSGFTGVYYPDAIFFKKDAPGNAAADARHGLASGAQFKHESGYQRPKPLFDAGMSADAAPVPIDQPQPQLLPVPRAVAPGNTAEVAHSPGHAVDDAPASAASYHAKALTALESGDHREAMQNLKRVLYLQPDSIVAHYLMGVVQAAEGRQRIANRQFEITDRLLAPFNDNDIVPASDGLSAAYLRASIRAFLRKENA